MMVEKFVQTYRIKSYEVDINNNLRIPTLLNMFQDSADGSANELGLGRNFCLEHGFAWVGANYHIKIFRLPKINEHIKIVTWPSAEKMLGAIRDFEVYDENEEKIIVASSQWILIDFIKKRPLNFKKEMPNHQIIDERALYTDFAKIPDPERADYVLQTDVRFDEIDLNGHVNNAVYPLWASEAIDKDFRIDHEPEEIEISFKKECHYQDNIKVITQFENQTSTCKIIATDDERELAKVRILWK